MMKMTPIELDGRTVIGIEVLLPKTTLLAVATDKGYIMCGADNVCGFTPSYKSLFKNAVYLSGTSIPAVLGIS